MAKKGGSGKTYTSKGERRSSIGAKTKNAGNTLMNKQQAWLNGSDPWITIPNPNKEETSKRFIKIRYSTTMHGTAKDRQKNMYVMK